MKKNICFALALTLSLCACEMRDEILNLSKVPDTNGTLAISLTANAPEALTRAASVDASGFPISIAGKGDVASVAYDYANISAMPASLQLPVGTYTVSAHTPGDLQRKMTAPYYMGADDVQILANVTTRHEVVCRMANSRLRLELTDEFRAAFQSWTITINDGTDQALSYTEASAYDDVFWHFLNNTRTIRVDIRAITVDGNSVYDSNTYSKASCNEGYMDIENECFTGGDAITLRFTPAVNTDGTLDGITVTANVTFENHDETVSIEVKDEGAADDPSVDPVDPPTGDEEIEVDFVNGSEFTVGYGTAAGYPDVQVDFSFPTGLKHLFVKVQGSSDFEFACGLMGLTTGDGLDLAGDAALELEALFNLPKAGDKTYSFSLNNALWQLLACDPGYPGTQRFTLKAVDANGMTKNGTLTVIIAN